MTIYQRAKVNVQLFNMQTYLTSELPMVRSVYSTDSNPKLIEPFFESVIKKRCYLAHRSLMPA